MNEEEKRMNPKEVASNFGRAVCPICGESRGVMFAFTCGQLVCQICRDIMTQQPLPRTPGVKKPIRCYICQDVVDSASLRKVVFKVAPYTYDESLQRLLQQQSEISEGFELAKRSRMEKIEFLNLKMSQLTELTEQKKRLKALLRELEES